MSFKDIFLLPNLITLLRLFSSLALFFYFTPDSFTTPILVLIITLIGISDSVDGIVARKFNLVSKLGIILDPFTDRVVFIVLLFWLNIYIPSSIFYSILSLILIIILKEILENKKKGFAFKDGIIKSFNQIVFF